MNLLHVMEGIRGTLKWSPSNLRFACISGHYCIHGYLIWPATIDIIIWSCLLRERTDVNTSVYITTRPNNCGIEMRCSFQNIILQTRLKRSIVSHVNGCSVEHGSSSHGNQTSLKNRSNISPSHVVREVYTFRIQMAINPHYKCIKLSLHFSYNISHYDHFFDF